MRYGLFGSFVAVDGKRDELLEILLKASELLQKNPDCIHYIVSISDDPDTIYVYETWTNKEAHEQSLVPEDVRAFIQKAMPLIKRMGDHSIELSTVGGKGL